MRQGPAAVGRRGAVLPLAMFLLVVLLGMAAFAVDIGYMVLVRSQLQNAADAAALAAADQLIQPSVQYNYPNTSTTQKTVILNQATNAATAAAQRIAGLNQAGGLTGLTVNASDVVPGFLDSQGVFSPTPPDPRFPNSVQVTVRRDVQANGPLGLFFAPIWGVRNVSLTATAQATVRTVASFNPGAGQNGKLLPVALDVRVWNQFLQNGTSSTSNNQVLTGPNGQLELQVYPDTGPFGSFGLVSIGPPATDDPSYRNWVTNGASPADLSYLVGNGLLPVSPSIPQYWPPGPGMKSSLQPDFASIIGQPRLIPLYDGSLPSNGNGYPIVGFAGVTVSEATGRGGNMNISVQPMAVVDLTGLAGGPAGNGVTTFSFTLPVLTT